MRPWARRIRRERWPCLEVCMYAIGVDKSGLLVGAGRKSAAVRPHKTAAKNSCVRFRFLQEWDSDIAALAAFGFWKARFGGFSFLGHQDSISSCAVGRPESEWPRPSLPEYPSHSKHNTTRGCGSCRSYNYDQKSTADAGGPPAMFHVGHGLR